MSKTEESIEQNLRSLSKYKKDVNNINEFVTRLDGYKSELDTINCSIENITEDLKHVDFIDFLYSKKSHNIISLGVVNKLIQQVKVCKNEMTEPEYINKADELYNILIKEGYTFIKDILDKSVDILYMNNDFTIFTNLVETDKQIKQIILWHRSRECMKKREYYKGDLNIFYRMMIKQECFIWYKLFYKDFIKMVNSLENSKSFTLYEKFLYSVMLHYFEDEEFIEIDCIEKKPILQNFSDNVEVQDYVYTLILNKCYREYRGDKKKVMEI